MKLHVSIKAHEANISSSFLAISDRVEEMATRALWELAASHPDKTVQFCSAMGSTTFSIVPSDYVRPPCMRAFERLEQTWGWGNTMPVVNMWIKDGKFHRLADWGRVDYEKDGL